MSEEELHTCRRCGFVRTRNGFDEYIKKYGLEPSPMGEQICDECMSDDE
jgi:hypothetical protein